MCDFTLCFGAPRLNESKITYFSLTFDVPGPVEVLAPNHRQIYHYCEEDEVYIFHDLKHLG